MTDLTDNMETTMNPVEGIDVENISTAPHHNAYILTEDGMREPISLTRAGLQKLFRNEPINPNIHIKPTNQKEEL